MEELHGRAARSNVLHGDHAQAAKLEQAIREGKQLRVRDGNVKLEVVALFKPSSGSCRRSNVCSRKTNTISLNPHSGGVMVITYKSELWGVEHLTGNPT